MPKGQNWWLLSHHHYELTDFDGIEVYRFLCTGVVEVMPWNRDANRKLFGAVWKGRKNATGKFHGTAVRKCFKTIEVWNFFNYMSCLTQIWIFYTFSMTWFIFYNKSIIFRLRNWFEVSLYQGVCCIQEIYSNAIWPIKYRDNSFARSWKNSERCKV